MTDILTRQAREPDLTVAYGPDPLHVSDLYRAVPPGTGVDERTARGLVVLLHGGFWRNRYDRLHLRPMAAALADEGFTVALPEFRRVGDSGGGFPGTFDDVRMAVQQLPAMAEQRLGAGIGGSVAVMGHSAGGHLALWSQVEAPGLPGVRQPNSRITRVIALGAVLDLAAAHAEQLSDDAVGDLLDANSADFEQRIALTDTMLLGLPDIRSTRTVLIHGIDDENVPARYSAAYAARDPGIRLHLLENTAHFELIDPLSDAWPTVLRALEE